MVEFSKRLLVWFLFCLEYEEHGEMENTNDTEGQNAQAYDLYDLEEKTKNWKVLYEATGVAVHIATIFFSERWLCDF